MLPTPEVRVKIEIEDSCNNCCDCWPWSKKSKASQSPQSPPTIIMPTNNPKNNSKPLVFNVDELAKKALQVKK